MKQVISFRLCPTNRAHPASHRGWILSPTRDLLESLFELGYDARNNRNMAWVEDPADSPRLRTAYALIEESLGMKPSKCRIEPISRRPEFFCVEIRREFEPGELDAADHLCVRALEPTAIASMARPCKDQEVLVTLDHWLLPEPRDIGSFCYGGLGCSDRMRSKLAALEWKGLDFIPVRVHPAGAAEPVGWPRMWGLTSSVVLPPAADALIDGRGDPFTGDYSRGVFYNDGGYEPHGPRYRREDLGTIPPFDIAVSRERTGLHDWQAFRHVVVSQRARQDLLRLGAVDLEFWPVPLLD